MWTEKNSEVNIGLNSNTVWTEMGWANPDKNSKGRIEWVKREESV